MSIKFQDGKLLFSNGKIAMDENCCTCTESGCTILIDSFAEDTLASKWSILSGLWYIRYGLLLTGSAQASITPNPTLADGLTLDDIQEYVISVSVQHVPNTTQTISFGGHELSVAWNGSTGTLTFDGAAIYVTGTGVSSCSAYANVSSGGWFSFKICVDTQRVILNLYPVGCAGYGSVDGASTDLEVQSSGGCHVVLSAAGSGAVKAFKAFSLTRKLEDVDCPECTTTCLTYPMPQYIKCTVNGTPEAYCLPEEIILPVFGCGSSLFWCPSNVLEFFLGEIYTGYSWQPDDGSAMVGWYVHGIGIDLGYTTHQGKYKYQFRLSVDAAVNPYAYASNVLMSGGQLELPMALSTYWFNWGMYYPLQYGPRSTAVTSITVEAAKLAGSAIDWTRRNFADCKRPVACLITFDGGPSIYCAFRERVTNYWDVECGFWEGVGYDAFGVHIGCSVVLDNASGYTGPAEDDVHYVIVDFIEVDWPHTISGTGQYYSGSPTTLEFSGDYYNSHGAFTLRVIY